MKQDRSIQYHIRPLEEHDLDQLAAFEAEIAISSFGDDAITDLATHKKRLSKAIGTFGAMVAETDTGEPAGWAWTVSRQNASTGEVYGDFRSFYIAKAHRGSRLTFLLMGEVVDYAQRNEWTRLVGRTAASNTAMQAVYQFMKFEPKHIVYELQLDGPAPTPKPNPSGGDAFHRRGSSGKKPPRRKTGNRRS